MVQKTVICNMCGKKFDMWDKSNGFSTSDQFGYGSKRDGDNIELDLCCDCMDKVVDYVVENCKINPITEN